VLVIKPHNKTPYELFHGRTPSLSFMRPFGCLVTILNTLDHLGKARVEIVPNKDYILLQLLTQDSPFSSSSKDSLDAGFKPSEEEEKKDAKVPEKKSRVSSKEDDQDDQDLGDEFERLIHQEKDENVSSTNNINTVSSTVNTASINDNAIDENIVYGCEDDPNMPNLEEIVYSDVGAEADMTNLTYPCQSYSNYQNSQGSSS
ncbi:hypothetical protein Tco_1511649, partial [Tanacetum coccineum]